MKPLIVRVRKQTGFTLLELMIVVAVGMIILGFAVPQFQQTLRNYRIAGDARSINGEILLAKMRAAANFTWSRVYFDIDNRTFSSQMWNKTTNNWEAVAVSGPHQVSPGVNFGFGVQTLDPNGDAIAMPGTCQIGSATPAPNGSPGGGGDEAGSSACIMFNSRGFPVDNSGNFIAESIYLTDDGQVHAVTVAFGGLSGIWRSDNTGTNYWIRH